MKIKGQRFLAYAYIIDGEFIPRFVWPSWLLEISVPILDLPYPRTIEKAKAQADELTSTITPGRKAEGIVWTLGSSALIDNYKASWKIVSDKYLEKRDR